MKEFAMRSTRYLRVLFAAITAILMGLAFTGSASAAVNVKTLPTAIFSGDHVTVSGGNFSGLGNIEAYAVVTVTGTASYDCLNPQGHASPGQNPVEAQPGTSGPVGLGNSDHNGRGTIPSTTAYVTAPATPSAQDVGCGGTGGTKWTVELKTLTATAAHLVVTQDGNVVYCRNFYLGGSSTGVAC